MSNNEERKIIVNEGYKRPSVPALERILGAQFPVLDHGHIQPLDYMGSDGAVVDAARNSYGKGTTKKSDDMGLINYLMRKRHTSPFEMPELRYHMKHPIFVARQWVRHRTASLNEYSGRYSIMSSDYYLPSIEQLQKQSQSNRQGRADAHPEHIASDIQETIKWACEAAWESYDILVHGHPWYKDNGSEWTTEDFSDERGAQLDYDPRLPHEGEFGIARELARGVLPVFFYTEWTWKQDLHNTFHLLNLRADGHAQWEIQQYANVLADITALWVPVCYNAFQQYVRMSTSFTGKELHMLRGLIDNEMGHIMFEQYKTLDISDKQVFGHAVSRREWNEFLEKVDAVLVA